jgi:hypothetical protein
MIDDIVTRLRKMGVYGPADTTLPIAQEAVDEIELLRKDCEFWEKRYWQLVAEVTP